MAWTVATIPAGVARGGYGYGPGCPIANAGAVPRIDAWRVYALDIATRTGKSESPGQFRGIVAIRLYDQAGIACYPMQLKRRLR